LNDFAWWLAVCGEDLGRAEKLTIEAIKILLKTQLQEASNDLASIYPKERAAAKRTAVLSLAAAQDTLAYIHLQHGRQEDAENEFHSAIVNSASAGIAPSEVYYRYWVTLRARGKSDEAARQLNFWKKDY
jgi:hypothetical protein